MKIKQNLGRIKNNLGTGGKRLYDDNIIRTKEIILHVSTFLYNNRKTPLFSITVRVLLGKWEVFAKKIN